MGVWGSAPAMQGSPPRARDAGRPASHATGRLPLHFNCPAAQLLIEAQRGTKRWGTCPCPVPPALPGHRGVVQPGSSRRWRAPASHAAALAGPAHSGQTKQDEKEAGSCAGRVCSAPGRRCQHRLPRPGTGCTPLRLPAETTGQCRPLAACASPAAPLCRGDLGCCDSRLLFWEPSRWLLK